ncbi:hypothetical protein [Deinococcus marmoris]|uniref:Uncharacterized protein n=1 Tax=Deinococcus marmoris TaxID=249408 RepID=A0A1U7P0K1_9DEIO|nr:hypothetical protein [Deinococcus marmoris]OLV17245.1 hypothetical protein BOO71_0009349 [Deinococcus marmoris]OLV18694.1 hypothetical protein BOO71_0005122 [Deinococcus marmoris]
MLLLSSDGGRETWGSPTALNTLRRAYRAALPHFRHDGRVYTLGISMGGLPATLTAYRRTLGFPINAVALVAGRVNLNNAVRTSKSRGRSVAAAFAGASTRGHDPVNDFSGFVGTKTPLLVVSSSQDQAVSGVKNGLLLATLARRVGAKTKVIGVMGPHLNPSVRERGYRAADRVVLQDASLIQRFRQQKIDEYESQALLRRGCHFKEHPDPGPTVHHLYRSPARYPADLDHAPAGAEFQ